MPNDTLSHPRATGVEIDADVLRVNFLTRDDQRPGGLVYRLAAANHRSHSGSCA